MGSPGAPSGFQVGIWTGATWDNITADVLDRSGRSPITIARGIPDEGSVAEPSECTYQLRNSSSKVNSNIVGRYTDTNPRSDLYGIIGRNTPLRVVKPVASDDFNRTETSTWGTSSSGHTWTTIGGDAADYDVSAGEATIDIDTVDSQRLAVLDASGTDYEILVPVSPGGVASGADIQLGAILRYADSSTFYEIAIQFHTDQTMDLVLVRHSSGATTLAIVALPGTYDSGTTMRIRAKIYGRALAAKAWNDASAEPYTWPARATDTSTRALTAAGDVGIRANLAAGNTNTLPANMTVGPLEVVHYRFTGEVAQWPPRWDVSGNDVWVDGEAAGILRRLGTSQAEHLSSLHRTMIGLNPQKITPWVYWPMEDGATAGAFASGLAGGAPLVISSGASPGTIDTLPGSLPLPVLDEDTKVDAPVTSYTDRGFWAVPFSLFVPDQAAGVDTVLAVEMTDGTLWTLELSFGTSQMLVKHRTDPSDTGTTVITESFDLNQVWDHWIVPVLVSEADSSGSTDRITATILDLDGDTITTGTDLFSTTSHQPVAVIRLNGFGSGTVGLDGAGYGHVGVIIDPAWNLGTDDVRIARAAGGWRAETAGRRAQRVCDEEDVPFIPLGDLDETPEMGPQQPGALLDILDSVTDVDLGLLFEPRDEIALAYRPRASFDNQPATLALSYSMAGHIAPSLEPLPDDLQVNNDLTVTRRGGSSARYEQTDGRLSTKPPPEGIGPYKTGVTLDLYNDEQPLHHASWRVHRNTIDAARYPAVPLDPDNAAIHSESAVLEGAHVLDVGHRLTIDDLPAWLPPDQADLLTMGLEETITLSRWKITPNAVPHKIYSEIAVCGPYPYAAHQASGTTGSWSVTVPPGSTEGALLLLLHACDVGGIADMGTPSGGTLWQLLHEAEDMAGVGFGGAARLWWKVAGPTEPATYGLTQAGNADGVAILAVVHGVDASLLISDFQASTSGSGTALPTPAVTMPDGGGLDLRFGAIPDDANTFTAPPGFGLIAGGEVATPFVSAGFAARLAPAGDAGTADFALASASTLGRFGATVLLPVPGGYSRYGHADAHIAAGLLLTGAVGDYASCPDAPALDITGDFDVRADVTVRPFPPPTDTLAAKWNDPDQISWLFILQSNGTLRLTWSTTGSNFISRTSTVPVQPSIDGRLRVRVVLDVDDGSSQHVVIFYTATDMSGPWTQLGDPVTTAGTTSIFASTSPLEVGALNNGATNVLAGLVHSVEVRDGIDGTAVADPDFDAQPAGATSFADSAGNTWSVNGNAKILGDFVAGTDTKLYVQTLAGPAYATDPMYYPLDLACSGARIRVDSMAAAVGPVQQATVQQAIVNGVNKAIAAKTAIEDWDRPRYGL